MLNELPDHVVELLQSGSIAEYATVSGAGVPIETPILVFPSQGLRSFDLTTGLSYPAKAERARKYPRVGLLIEGGPGDPVVSIGGIAAVRDSDLQANVDRYLSEAGLTLPGNPDWSVASRAVWYWTRILIEVTPANLLWWDNSSAMDGPPQRWDAPAGTAFPHSDPAPPGLASEAPSWQQPPWRELARRALGRGGGGHLSLIDAEGFPRPIGVRTIVPSESGFTLELPKGLPWPLAGKASLTFGGIETFIGEVTGADGAAVMRVERALPLFPMTSDMSQLWEPTADTREKLMKRLRHETERRGQPIPAIPSERPAPSESYRLRMARGQLTPLPGT